LPVVDVGLNVTVTPEGCPVALKATLDVKPVRVMVIVLLPLWPALRLRLVGLAASVKPATVSENCPTPLAPVRVQLSVGEEALGRLPAVAAKVMVVVVVKGVGLNEALTPAGNPEMVHVVFPLPPLTETVALALAPGATLTLAGVTLITRPDEVTLRLIDVVCVRPPPVPLMVTVTGPPSAAVADAASVSTLLFPVVLFGLKEAVTPLGKPLALRVTALVKLVRAIVIVLVVLLPWATLRLVGLAERVKSPPEPPNDPV